MNRSKKIILVIRMTCNIIGFFIHSTEGTALKIKHDTASFLNHQNSRVQITALGVV